MKNILLGVTGGIAAYKSANIISLLKKKGYNVKVIMTKNATEIIGPITLETLSRNRVYIDMWDEKGHYEVEHIALADWADLVLVAPATYNIVGKVANGIADDMLSTVIAATKKPVYFALAMNVNMYENPILKENIEKLKKYNYKFIEADEGLLACNYVAKGRLKDEVEIVNLIEKYFLTKNIEGNLKGKKILITASRTREDIDPVRYLTNNSSGKMGYSLAEAAANLGAEVYLVSGPSELKQPINIKEFIKINSAKQMYNEVSKRFDNCDIFISCAAVADYKPKNYSNIKIKKSDGDLVIELDRNPDILFEMGKKKKNQFLVGFAAETNDILANASKKLNKKNLDMIVANNAKVMNQDGNEVTIIKKNGPIVKLASDLKENLAYEIMAEIIKTI